MWKLFILLFVGILQAELVDIGSGRTLYLQCEGSGAPPVVLISGRSDRADVWKKVMQEVSKHTLVCAYDRPGTISFIDGRVKNSRSTEVTQPRSVRQAVDDLHAVLKNVKGPYVLVAHSYGGLIARLYAQTYSKEVIGLVLVDTLSELLYKTLNEKDRADWARLNNYYSEDLDKVIVQERINLIKSLEEMGPDVKVPAIVLTSDEPYDFKELIKEGILPKGTPIEFGDVVFKAHLKSQDELAKRFNAKHITNTHAGHYIQVEQPQLVIDAILEVVKQTKTSP